jgi:hypothetical protein
MLRTTLQLAYLKRTIRPLYGWTQSTPKSAFLDPAWDRSVNIWPGMCMMKTVGQNYTLLNTVGVPAGLCGLYIGGDGIDEVLEQGINAIAVWVLDPDAEFQILSPAFDTAQTWTDPGTGVDTFVSASTTGANRGKLVPAGVGGASTKPIARLISVDSLTQITIGGLNSAVA